MKKTLIIAGLISAAGLAAAAPAAAAPTTVSCSPMPLCQVTGSMGAWQTSVTDFFTKGPKTFQDSVTDFVTKGPKTFQDSITNPTGATG